MFYDIAIANALKKRGLNMLTTDDQQPIGQHLPREYRTSSLQASSLLAFSPPAIPSLQTQKSPAVRRGLVFN